MRSLPLRLCASLCCLVLAAGVAPSASAAVTAAEAAKLGKELTPVGATRAGNKDGSIPEYTGEKNFPEEAKKYTRAKLEELRKKNPDKLEDDFKKNVDPAAVNPLFEITKANMAQHAAKLTEGQKAMLTKYPTFKMKVYKSVRTAYYPKEIEEATIANATTAVLTGTDDLKGAKMGFPFPIPKNGAEVIWNHKWSRRRGSRARSRSCTSSPAPRAVAVRPGSTRPVSPASPAHPTWATTIPHWAPTTSSTTTRSTSSTARWTASTGSWSARRRCTSPTTPTRSTAPS